jgi:hypothetical protein
MISKLKTNLVNSSILLSVSLLPVSLHVLRGYIDPGTGSLIIQAAIAALAGGLYLTKVFWNKVKGFFGKLFSKSTKSDG